MCVQSACHFGQPGPTSCQVSDPMGLSRVCISASDFWEVPAARGSMTFVGIRGSAPLLVEGFLQGPWLLGRPAWGAGVPVAAHLPFVKAELKVHPHREERQPGWARKDHAEPPRGLGCLVRAHSGLRERAAVSTTILKGFLCGWVRTGLTLYSESELGHVGAPGLFCRLPIKSDLSVLCRLSLVPHRCPWRPPGMRGSRGEGEEALSCVQPWVGPSGQGKKGWVLAGREGGGAGLHSSLAWLHAPHPPTGEAGEEPGGREVQCEEEGRRGSLAAQVTR